MNRIFASVCTLALATFATACSQQAATKVDAKKVDNLAVVNGHAINRNTFNEYAKGVAGKPAEDLTEVQRKDLLDNLIRAEVLAKEAETNGVTAQDETRAALDLSRLNVLSNAMTRNYLKDRKPSEEELRAEYDIQIASMPKTEYRISHIQLPTEEAARQAIAQLKAGANFAELARKISADKASAEHGGDLNWTSPTNLPPEFIAAVSKLKKGETAAAPVRSSFGFHVLQVTDTRGVSPPAYEAVKDRLVKIVENKKFSTYTDGLVAKAKITKTP